ncbi:type II toxin-antitoxin system RelE/ParE family toxin [Danxiaibacter flavus]|uniref:Type II toxin-antitoxin system RelE/ParE family toxin n=1 Tax=Danxiaibacter flavus TaxID=3049108 RepID=A0ABV3ZHH8_9BACT|nr:type II toxin-antitoxin system RelE/ParE family toxin [Chitinophagaceae bacterium DXS]
MNYKVVLIDKFRKEAKRLIKKYPSLKDELYYLADTLSLYPRTGTSLGNDVYKIRVAIRSKAKGKSGGARVITYLVTENKEVYLLTIYDKAEFDNIDNRTLKKIIENIKDGM